VFDARLAYAKLANLSRLAHHRLAPRYFAIEMGKCRLWGRNWLRFTNESSCD